MAGHFQATEDKFHKGTEDIACVRKLHCLAFDVVLSE